MITEGRAPCVPPLFPMMPPDTQFLTPGPPDAQRLLSSLPGVPTPTQEPSAHISWLLGKWVWMGQGWGLTTAAKAMDCWIPSSRTDSTGQLRAGQTCCGALGRTGRACWARKGSGSCVFASTQQSRVRNNPLTPLSPFSVPTNHRLPCGGREGAVGLMWLEWLGMALWFVHSN